MSHESEQTAEFKSTEFDYSAIGRSTVIIDWPTDTSTQKYWLTGIAIGGLLALCMWSVLREDHLLSLDVSIILSCAVLMLILAVGFPFFGIRRIMRARRPARAALERAERGLEPSPTTAEILTALFTLNGYEPTPDSGEEMEFEQLAQQFRKLNLELPRFVIDRRIADDIATIDCPNELLEREPVTSRHHARRYVFAALRTTVAAFLLSVLWGESILWSIVAGLFALQGAWSIAKLWLFGRAPSHIGITAGPGFIEGESGGSFGSWQVMTLVSKGTLRSIWVQFLMPDSRGAICFSSINDEGFIAFWQRWNHPNPRPELLG